MSRFSAVRGVNGFFKKEEGSASVELVMWFPMVILIFALMVDVSMIFHGQSQALRILQDGNRNMSIGRFTTVQETETYIEGRLAHLTPSAVATSSVTAGVLSTSVTFPANDMQILGLFSQFNTLMISVRADHLIEDWEAS